jgi:hypothetical protein
MSKFDSQSEDQSVKRQILSSLGLLFNIGWYIAFSLILPTALGLWMDSPEIFNSRPLCTIIGFFLGTIIAAYGFYRMMKRFITEQKNISENKNYLKEQDSE